MVGPSIGEDPTGAPSAFFNRPADTCRMWFFLFFARYKRDRARDNEHFVSASFLNLQRGIYSPRGRVSFEEAWPSSSECNYECNYSFKRTTYTRAIKKKLVVGCHRIEILPLESGDVNCTERKVDSKEKERVFSRHFYPFYTTGKAPPGGTVFTYQ